MNKPHHLLAPAGSESSPLFAQWNDLNAQMIIVDKQIQELETILAPLLLPDVEKTSDQGKAVMNTAPFLSKLAGTTDNLLSMQSKLESIKSRLILN